MGSFKPVMSLFWLLSFNFHRRILVFVCLVFFCFNHQRLVSHKQREGESFKEGVDSWVATGRQISCVPILRDQFTRTAMGWGLGFTSLATYFSWPCSPSRPWCCCPFRGCAPHSPCPNPPICLVSLSVSSPVTAPSPSTFSLVNFLV
jgi:hypothetical protein